MLLNHMLAGVLLIPLGFLTVYAAPHAVSGASWARVTVRVIALSVASLPIILFAFTTQALNRMLHLVVDRPIFARAATDNHRLDKSAAEMRF